jgi:hypothetical protein
MSDISFTARRIPNSQVLVDLAGLSVLPQQSPENPLPPHPQDLSRHTSIGGTLSLTGTSVTTLSLSSEELTGTSTGVDGGGLNDDSTVLDEFLDVCS